MAFCTEKTPCGGCAMCSGSMNEAQPTRTEQPVLRECEEVAESLSGEPRTDQAICSWMQGDCKNVAAHYVKNGRMFCTDHAKVIQEEDEQEVFWLAGSRPSAPAPTYCPFCDSGLMLSEEQAHVVADLSNRLGVTPNKVWHLALATYQLKVLGVPEVGDKAPDWRDAEKKNWIGDEERDEANSLQSVPVQQMRGDGNREDEGEKAQVLSAAPALSAEPEADA